MVCSLSSYSILGHLDSKEQVVDSQDGFASLEELTRPPQPLQRIHRGLGKEALEAAVATVAPSAFALPSDYLQHVSAFCLEFWHHAVAPEPVCNCS